MDWHLVIGICVLGVVGWLTWKLSHERNIIPSDDADRILFTIGILVVLAIVVSAAHVLNSKIPAVVSLFCTLGAFALLAVIWVPRMGSAVLDPLTSAFDGGDDEVEAKAFYHRAQAYRKQGKYSLAIEEIRSQLESFPDSAEGWMLLAEVQSDDLKDIPAALGTLTTIVATPDWADRDRILAFSRMADLELRREDTAAARRALDQIVEGWPDTDAARLAQQRIAHLPGQELLEARREAAVIPLGNYEKNLGLKTAPSETREPALASPAQQASALLNRISRYPQDWETREQLAMLYARHFKRYDLAKDQLEILLEAPGQPDKAVVRWLNLLADLQLDAPDGIRQASETLQRIADRLPGTPWAENAISRIARLGLETKAREIPKSIRIGSYEQNIGLKHHDRPEPPAPEAV